MKQRRAKDDLEMIRLGHAYLSEISSSHLFSMSIEQKQY